MRLIALRILGGPVLQMGGGWTKPGVIPEHRTAATVRAPAPGPDPTEKAGCLPSRTGGCGLRCHPWHPGLAQEPEGFGGSFRKACKSTRLPPAQSESGATPPSPAPRAPAVRGTLCATFSGMDPFLGPFWGLTACPLSGRLHPKKSQ